MPVGDDWPAADEMGKRLSKLARKWDDAALWSGCHTQRGVPRLMVFLRLRDISLPLSLALGGHLLARRGFTFGVGPVYFSWSWV